MLGLHIYISVFVKNTISQRPILYGKTDLKQKLTTKVSNNDELLIPSVAVQSIICCFPSSGIFMVVAGRSEGILQSQVIVQ